ncbi:hypothetical protein [Hyphomicrobium sp.]|uniref:hypothetical protein n=1 Tax=Hyphomicrobium sp. TaxID=82 RepID=UPI002E37252E|nr:hypothetical protein [Hyphomicrobium sp.]HEX2840502.1 hypothetical protein [Hyphomicrobium sp.]
MCTKEAPDLRDIKSTGFGEMEREWLHLVRLHCMSYEHNHAEGWDRAISHAEMRYGAENGPSIASRVAVLIRAMRAERRGGFGYLSPYCPSCCQRVTDDEWELVTLMQAGYRGEPFNIEEAAAEFARRNEAPSLAAAAARFGKTIVAAVGARRPAPSHDATLH